MKNEIRKALIEKMNGEIIEFDSLESDVREKIESGDLFRGAKDGPIEIELYLDCENERDIFVEKRYGKIDGFVFAVSFGNLCRKCGKCF